MSLLALVLAAPTINEHTFKFVAETSTKSVNVAGTFNGWNKDTDPMRLGTDGRTWTLTKDLSPGKHLYKFVVDGDRWIVDPNALRSEDDGNGNVNSVLLISPPGYDVPAKKGDGKVTASAVRHPQQPPDLNWDRGRLTLRLTTRNNDVRAVSLQSSSGLVNLVEKPQDDFTSTWTADVAWSRKQDFVYTFQIEDGEGEPFEYDKIGLRDPRMKRATVPFTLGAKSFVPFAPPAWVEKSVVYQIFPDRFANGSKANDPASVVRWGAEPTYANFMGGDLAGIRAHMSHLQSLGVGCVYLNPIFEGPSNHHYETTDYLRVDHRIGSNQEFAQLTKALHAGGIKTVLDGVFNHTSVDFFAFRDLLANQSASNYKDWYTVRSFPVSVSDPPPYEAWWGFKSMPKLNNSNPEVRKHLLRVPGFWATTAHIDGWRLDVANEVPHDFWKQFRQKVKAAGQDKWIVGEHWGDASDWLKGDEWDSTMNYQFRGAVLGFVAQGKTTPSQFWSAVMRTYDAYGPQVSRNMMNLLGSHDTPRILDECGKDARLARLAAMVQFTWVGAPCVYYGDELGMAGGRDPDNRRAMEWGAATASNPTLKLYKALSLARRRSTVLQSGDPSLVKADDRAKTLVFKRQFGSKWAIVALNRADSPANITVPCPRGRANIQTYVNETSTFIEKSKSATISGQQLSVTVAPLSMTLITSGVGPSTTKTKRKRL